MKYSMSSFSRNSVNIVDSLTAAFKNKDVNIYFIDNEKNPQYIKTNRLPSGMYNVVLILGRWEGTPYISICHLSHSLYIFLSIYLHRNVKGFLPEY